MTDIEWCDATWNPIVGCSRVSAGCTQCYAERFVHRGLAPQHRGLTVVRGGRPGWTGEVRLVADRLAEPLSWKRPRRIFVNSLSDLFHEALSIPDIARVFAVMAHASQHTFQVLTKRPRRMWQILSSELFWVDVDSASSDVCVDNDLPETERDRVANLCGARVLPNLWLGVTAEDQTAANERAWTLCQTPAAVRFISYEPALGPVDFTDLDFMPPMRDPSPLDPVLRFNALTGLVSGPCEIHEKVDWVIVGGESGPGARPFDLAWARAVVEQCREAGMPVFVKQLGAEPVAVPMEGPYQRTTAGGDPWPAQPLRLRHRKGADPNEWPADLRVREFPEVRT